MAVSRTWDRRGGGRPRVRPRRRLVSDESFNLWLDQKLLQLFEAELAEPIPEEMLRLLESLDGSDE